MGDVKLGRLLIGNEHRDAIHIAVAPVTAGVLLQPGQRAGVRGGYAWPTEPHHGVVDPYLEGPVREGQRFWLFLLPESVTGMRHVWSHPTFSDSDSPLPTPAQITAGESGSANDARAASEAWLRRYAERMNSYDEPETAYQHLLEGLRAGTLFAHGSDLHGRYDLDQEEELRLHAEAVLGIRIDFGRFEYSCSC